MLRDKGPFLFELSVKVPSGAKLILMSVINKTIKEISYHLIDNLSSFGRLITLEMMDALAVLWQV